MPTVWLVPFRFHVPPVFAVILQPDGKVARLDIVSVPGLLTTTAPVPVWFAETVNVPAFTVSVPLKSLAAFSATLTELSSVKLFSTLEVVGSSLPTVMALEPV